MKRAFLSRINKQKKEQFYVLLSRAFTMDYGD